MKERANSKQTEKEKRLMTAIAENHYQIRKVINCCEFQSTYLVERNQRSIFDYDRDRTFHERF